MKVIEFFSGSGIMSHTFAYYGHDTLTIDDDPDMKADLCVDIGTLDDTWDADIMWFSPPCETFSVASIGTHWMEGHKPRTRECMRALALLDKCLCIIAASRPTYWYIENPRGMMRKVIDDMMRKRGVSGYRHTVTYCQYGDKRMKPTDIWTNNINWKPRTICKNGSPCHTRAPRGSKTGTQGMKSRYLKAMIPAQLCDEIVEAST